MQSLCDLWVVYSYSGSSQYNFNLSCQLKIIKHVFVGGGPQEAYLYIVGRSEYAVQNSVPKRTWVPFPVLSVYKQAGSSSWINWGWEATQGGGRVG